MCATPTDGRATVPVLLFHAVTDTPGAVAAPFACRPDDFDRHLDAVLAAGYRCVTFSELLRLQADGAPLDGLAVLTFDDGYADFASAALPRLSARSLVCTLYLTTGWLQGRGERPPGPTDPMLSFDQLPELIEQGVELGAHSHSHPQMDTLRSRQLQDELVRPKAILEDVLDRPVTSFAYPHGYNGPRVRRATRQAGYDSAAAVRNVLHLPDEDRYAVSRLTVTAHTRADDVSAWLAGVEGRPPRGGESWKTRGWRAYRRGRALLTRRPGSDYA